MNCAETGYMELLNEDSKKRLKVLESACMGVLGDSGLLEDARRLGMVRMENPYEKFVKRGNDGMMDNLTDEEYNGAVKLLEQKAKLWGSESEIACDYGKEIWLLVRRLTEIMESCQQLLRCDDVMEQCVAMDSEYEELRLFHGNGDTGDGKLGL